jgi:hypothetical protein
MYTDFDEFATAFEDNTITSFTDITIGEEQYSKLATTGELFESDDRFIVYGLINESEDKVIACVFERRNLSLTPCGIRILEVEMPEESSVIGTSVEVAIASLGHETVKARVDTGASMCCLHGSDVKAQDGSVQFTTSWGRRITAPTTGSTTIKQADSEGESRPIVKLDIEINGKTYNDIEFNINDRGHMDFPILLGRNFLEQSQLLVKVEPKEQATSALETFAQEMETSTAIYEHVYPTQEQTPESILNEMLETLSEKDMDQTLTISELLWIIKRKLNT